MNMDMYMDMCMDMYLQHGGVHVKLMSMFMLCVSCMCMCQVVPGAEPLHHVKRKAKGDF